MDGSHWMGREKSGTLLPESEDRLFVQAVVNISFIVEWFGRAKDQKRGSKPETNIALDRLNNVP